MPETSTTREQKNGSTLSYYTYKIDSKMDSLRLHTCISTDVDSCMHGAPIDAMTLTHEPRPCLGPRDLDVELIPWSWRFGAGRVSFLSVRNVLHMVWVKRGFAYVLWEYPSVHKYTHTHHMQMASLQCEFAYVLWDHPSVHKYTHIHRMQKASLQCGFAYVLWEYPSVHKYTHIHHMHVIVHHHKSA